MSGRKFFSNAAEAFGSDAQVGSNVGLWDPESEIRIGLDKVQVTLFRRRAL